MHVFYGGSFNPVHTGHVEIVRRLCSMAGVSVVYVVPSGLSPGRTRRQKELLPWQLRFDMLQAALAPLMAPAVSGRFHLFCGPLLTEI
jgi:cytidyltransferase-like protein